MDDVQAIEGDINGDGRPDCILSYVFTPKEGGNAIVGHVCTIYINTGNGMKNAGNFPEFKFCYGLDKIENQLIIVGKYTCMPPYNDDLGKAKLAYRGGKIVLVK